MAQEQVLGGGGGVSASSAVPGLTAPHGLEQILATFGDIHDYVGKDGSLDPRWQADSLARVGLPFGLKLAWDPTTTVQQMTCHKRLVEVFTEVFEQIVAAGLEQKIQTFGGCFSFRPQRTGSKLSAHAWGIAIDLNPGTNAQSTAGDMAPELIAIFRGVGFEWGGDWNGARRDPMHFQFCTGY